MKTNGFFHSNDTTTGITRAILTEPFTEFEAGVYNQFYTAVQTGKMDAEKGKNLLEYFDLIYTSRKVCQKVYPWMTHKEISQATYDDMNIRMRENENSPYITKIFPLEEYKVTREESIKRTQTTKIKALLTDPLSYFANQSELEHDVEKIPVKIWDDC